MNDFLQSMCVQHRQVRRSKCQSTGQEAIDREFEIVY